MFADAYEEVTKFTRPFLISMRRRDGQTGCSIGCYIVLNEEGWIATAYHIVDLLIKCDQQRKEYLQYESERARIEADESLKGHARKQALRRINVIKKDHVTHYSPWLGMNNLAVEDWKCLPEIDLAVGKMKNFRPEMIPVYPRFFTGPGIRPGTSLCRIGFPFNAIQPNFDEAAERFTLPNVPLAYFPIEGILTREVRLPGDKQLNGVLLQYIETSSPGLKGQSGGPIFDRDGVVWGIQSQTSHFPLGFERKIQKQQGRSSVSEEAWLDCGLGVHPRTLTAFLDDNKITYAKST